MTRTILAAAFFLVAMSAATGATAYAAPPCTLLAVDKPESAKLKVYFTKFAKEDNTGGKYKTCRIVTKAQAETTTFFVTPFRQDATVLVHRDNWPQ